MKKFNAGNYAFPILMILFFSVSACQSEKGTDTNPDSVQTEQTRSSGTEENTRGGQAGELTSTAIDGQQRISNEELSGLSDLNMQMRAVRSQLSEDLRNYIKEQGYTMEEYQQLSARPEGELTAAEQEAIRKISDRMADFQMEVSTRMEKMVNDAGYTMEEFLEKGRMISRDPEMRAKVER